MDIKKISLTFIVTSICFLLLAGISGAFGGLAILKGGMLGAISGSTFISMHLSMGHLGWIIMAMFGLYLGLCYHSKAGITYGACWFNRVYWVYLAGITAAVVLIALGYGNEQRYGETVWPFALLFMAILAMFIVLIFNLFRQTKNTREIAIYYFLISLIFIALYLAAIAVPLAGLSSAIALNVATHLLFDGMMLAIMGLSVYILPRIAGRPLYSEMLAFVQIWMVLMMVGLTASRHVVRLEILNSATMFWSFFYNSLAVVFICVYFFNIYMTVRGAKPKEDKPAYWALVISNGYLGIVAFQGLGFLYMLIYRGQGAAKMLITLHAHFALFGFVTLGLMGAMFYFLPRLVEGFKIEDRLQQGIFYTLNSGMLLSLISTSLKNISPAEAHFADHLTANTLETYYLTTQYLGDTLLLVTSLLFAWAVFKNLVNAGVRLPFLRMVAVLVLAVGLVLGNWWPAPGKTALVLGQGSMVAVANEGDGTVSLLNGTGGKLIRLLRTGGSPHNVNFDPLGRYLWVTDHSDQGRVLGYSLQDFKLVAEISLTGAAGHVVPSFDGRHLFVTGEGDDQVVIIDTETFAVIRTIETETMPHGLVLSGDRKTILVPNMMSDSVSIIDISTGNNTGMVYVCTDSLQAAASQGISHDHVEQEAGTAPGYGSNMAGHEMAGMEKMTMPAAMGISPRGDRAYVSLAGTDQVAEIDIPSQQVSRVVQLPGNGEIGPIQLPVHPNGQHLYVPSMSTGKVFKIELEGFKIVGEIATGAGAHGVAYSHGGRYAFVTNTYDQTLACIDTLTDEVIFVEPVGLDPNGVAVLNGKNQGW